MFACMEPLATNPGGRLDLNDIVGREKEIARYWRVLARQSLVLGAERRLGKTHIVLKMHGKGRDGFTTIYQDLEAVHGVMELVRTVYRSVDQHLKLAQKAKGRVINAWEALLPKKIGATELPEARTQWKTLVTQAVRDTLEAIDGDQKVVFVWDELPLMLHNIAKREGASYAIELLDLLRALRVENAERLRFVFTGSIGLHLVLRTLRSAGNANDPTNDMQHETVPPMAEAEAVELAHRLLLGLPFPPTETRDYAKAVAELVEGFPYYIHHTIDQLSLLDHHPSRADLAAAVEKLALSDNDPAHLAYYDQRLTTYYEAAEARLARVVLTALAKQQEPQSFEQVSNLARHVAPETTDEQIENVCLLLRQDHYLTLDGASEAPLYRFRWGVVKRWWRATHK